MSRETFQFTFFLLISNVACNQLHAAQPSSNQANLLHNISWVNPFLATIWKSIFIPPTLKQLTWWPGLDTVFIDTPGIIFANISYLKVPYPLSTDELLSLLAYFPHIKEVAVSDLRPPKLPVLSSHTQLPLALTLEALRLTVGVDVSPLFDGLYCPALRFLTLDYSGAMTPSKDVTSSLLAFLRRSESCLKELVIRHNHTSYHRDVKLTMATKNLASPGLRLLSALEVDPNVVRDELARMEI
ncbi:hypothetical protein GALMADRAFT_137606 [Galerina marginata CBS 339.88]|uniref:Uncharacterized protein n=1 Tax=Galerina marginata (strain CBS 339.88) TaxID=685588 RepID=A0A067T5V0_GALM3|nr:hypothetical protein GALMADRAFT_137606 [Galerina marginata CBS 339.88]